MKPSQPPPPSTPKPQWLRDRSRVQAPEGLMGGSVVSRTVQVVEGSKISDLNIPPGTSPAEGTPLDDRVAINKTKEKEVQKDPKDLLKDELKKQANAISPEIGRKIEVICRRELSESALKEIQKELDFTTSKTYMIQDYATKYINNLFYMSRKIEIIIRREPNDDTKLKIVSDSLETLAMNQKLHDSKAEKSINELFCLEFTEKMNELLMREEYRKIFIDERSKVIAGLLLDHEGNLDIESIDIIKDLINTSPLKETFPKAHNEILRKTLDTLKSNPDLIDLLNNLEEPGKGLPEFSLKKQNIQSMIRSTLGLEEGAELTAMHSKQAVLSALLTDIRQGEMGSCFATAIAIMMHDQNPLQVAQDLKTMIQSGELRKEINGKTVIIHIPNIHIPTQFGEGLLFDTFSGQQQFVRSEKFFQIPGIRKAIKMAGLDEAKKEDKEKLLKMLEDALNKVPVSPEKSGDIFRSFLNELAMYQIGLEQADFDNTRKYDELTWEWRPLEKERRAIQETMNQEGRSQEEIDASTLTLTTRIDDLNQQREALLLKFDTNAKFKGSEMKDKFRAHEDFKQRLEMNFMAAEGENSLLRSWEYAIASHGRSKEGLFNGLFSAVIN